MNLHPAAKPAPAEPESASPAYLAELKARLAAQDAEIASLKARPSSQPKGVGKLSYVMSIPKAAGTDGKGEVKGGSLCIYGAGRFPIALSGPAAVALICDFPTFVQAVTDGLSKVFPNGGFRLKDTGMTADQLVAKLNAGLDALK